MSRKIIVYISCFLVFLFCNPSLGWAQVPPNPCPDPKLLGCPIDTNLYLFILAAIFIAARKTFFIKNVGAKNIK